VRRNRYPPAPGQLDLPLVDPPPDPDGPTERPPLPRGWTPEGPVIVDEEAIRRRERATAAGVSAGGPGWIGEGPGDEDLSPMW
jgi:hypothetical protein